MVLVKIYSKRGAFCEFNCRWSELSEYPAYSAYKIAEIILQNISKNKIIEIKWTCLICAVISTELKLLKICQLTIVGATAR